MIWLLILTGSDPLLCLLFEIDVPSEHSSPSSLHNVAAVWRYRSQITMDHLLHTVQVQAPTHKVLLMFLQEVRIVILLVIADVADLSYCRFLIKCEELISA